MSFILDLNNACAKLGFNKDQHKSVGVLLCLVRYALEHLDHGYHNPRPEEHYDELAAEIVLLSRYNDPCQVRTKHLRVVDSGIPLAEVVGVQGVTEEIERAVVSQMVRQYARVLHGQRLSMESARALAIRIIEGFHRKKVKADWAKPVEVWTVYADAHARKTGGLY